ncbi:MAG: tetratricopeptide repeat protein [Methanobacterium sp.]|uniref:tetratricopeptide repeat protein n=1 Tax=Methanobacterium sp. TaxID=2164 RepID=UPI003D653AEF|nr:tetratricopeptide repeat protein [Methanobacterium sp.]
MGKNDGDLALKIGSKFYGRGELEKALVYYNQALDTFEEVGDLQKEADTLLEIGDIYIELNDTKMSRKFYKKSQKIYIKNKDIIGEGYALTGMGVTYQNDKEYEESREYYKKALKKFQKAKDNERTPILTSLIADTYESQDAVEDALIKYEKSLKLFGEIKDTKRENEIIEIMDNLKQKKLKSRLSRNQLIILIGYLVLIIIAELITSYVNPEAGILVHGFILFSLLIQSSTTKSYNFSNILMAMMALPMIRIVGLTMPLLQVPVLYWFPVISIPLFAAAIIIIRVQGTSRISLGLTWGNIPVQLLIAFTGVILGFIEYQVLHPKPLIPYFSIETVLIAGIILLISTGLAEELLFRGIIQRNAENLFGGAFGLLYASLLFTSLHIGWQSLTDLAFVFSVAMLYGYCYQKTRSIFGITLSHGLSNTFLFLIMPFITEYSIFGITLIHR